MEVDSRCECGSPLKHARYAWGCVECGAACCPVCAWELESAAYCRSCAHWLLHDALSLAPRSPVGGRLWK